MCAILVVLFFKEVLFLDNEETSDDEPERDFQQEIAELNARIKQTRRDIYHLYCFNQQKKQAKIQQATVAAAINNNYNIENTAARKNNDNFENTAAMNNKDNNENTEDANANNSNESASAMNNNTIENTEDTNANNNNDNTSAINNNDNIEKTATINNNDNIEKTSVINNIEIIDNTSAINNNKIKNTAAIYNNNIENIAAINNNDYTENTATNNNQNDTDLKSEKIKEGLQDKNKIGTIQTTIPKAKQTLKSDSKVQVQNQRDNHAPIKVLELMTERLVSMEVSFVSVESEQIKSLEKKANQKEFSTTNKVKVENETVQALEEVKEEAEDDTKDFIKDYTKDYIKHFNKEDLKAEIKVEVKDEIEEVEIEEVEIKVEVKDEIKEEVKDEIKEELKDEIEEVKTKEVEIQEEVKDEIKVEIQEVEIQEEVKHEQKEDISKPVDASPQQANDLQQFDKNNPVLPKNESTEIRTSNVPMQEVDKPVPIISVEQDKFDPECTPLSALRSIRKRKFRPCPVDSNLPATKRQDTKQGQTPDKSRLPAAAARLNDSRLKIEPAVKEPMSSVEVYSGNNAPTQSPIKTSATPSVNNVAQPQEEKEILANSNKLQHEHHVNKSLGPGSNILTDDNKLPCDQQVDKSSVTGSNILTDQHMLKILKDNNVSLTTRNVEPIKASSVTNGIHLMSTPNGLLSQPRYLRNRKLVVNLAKNNQFANWSASGDQKIQTPLKKIVTLPNENLTPIPYDGLCDTIVLANATLQNNQRKRNSLGNTVQHRNLPVKVEPLEQTAEDDDDDEIQVLHISPVRDQEKSRLRPKQIQGNLSQVEISLNESEDIINIDLDDEISILSTPSSPFRRSTPYNTRSSTKNLNTTCMSTASYTLPSKNLNLTRTRMSQRHKMKRESNSRRFFRLGPKESLIIEQNKIELTENPDFFPLNGPYMCEICRMFVKTSREFVHHVRTRHEDELDETVLNIMEKHLDNNDVVCLE